MKLPFRSIVRRHENSGKNSADSPNWKKYMFLPRLEPLEDRWVPSALAIKIESGAISFIVNDNGLGDLDPTTNSILFQSGVGGSPIIPGFNLQSETAFANTPGSATGAILETHYT